ncbi:MAG: hypothetical protein COC23_02080 [Hyphomicrobiales bacterium]|nr:MAG: hypothetical protein COC23_02080 [Hyphomicrobiales bacterium]
MSELNVEEIRMHLLAAAKRQGFNQWLAPELLVAERDRVEISVQVRPEMTQHHGFVHGGCVAALADTACAWTGAMACGRDVVTSNYSIHFVAPAIGTKLRAVGIVLKTGRTMVTVEVKVYAEAEDRPPKLCATGMASIAILPEKKAA